MEGNFYRHGTDSERLHAPGHNDRLANEQSKRKKGKNIAVRGELLLKLAAVVQAERIFVVHPHLKNSHTNFQFLTFDSKLGHGTKEVHDGVHRQSQQVTKIYILGSCTDARDKLVCITDLFMVVTSMCRVLQWIR